MLTTHIYFNGQCKQAIELYRKAFAAEVKTFIEDSDNGHVIHAEIMIHDGLLIVNDFGNNDGISKSEGYQLCVNFENEAALKEAYHRIENGSVTIEPLQSADYSPCTVRFVDRFGVRWAFWV